MFGGGGFFQTNNEDSSVQNDLNNKRVSLIIINIYKSSNKDGRF